MKLWSLIPASWLPCDAEPSMIGPTPLCPLTVAPWGPHPRTISGSIPFQLHAIGPRFYVTVQLQILEGQPDIPLECPQDSSDSTSLKQKSSSSLQPCMNGTSFQKPEFACLLLTHPPCQVLASVTSKHLFSLQNTTIYCLDDPYPVCSPDCDLSELVQVKIL